MSERTDPAIYRERSGAVGAESKAPAAGDLVSPAAPHGATGQVDQGALAPDAGVLIAPEADESVDIDDEALASGAGAGAGVAIGAAAGGVVEVVVSVSFLLQPAMAATLKESAAMRLSDRMEAPGFW